jgi:hypothetical protein
MGGRRARVNHARLNALASIGSPCCPSTRSATYSPTMGPNLNPSADPPPASHTFSNCGCRSDLASPVTQVSGPERQSRVLANHQPSLASSS